MAEFLLNRTFILLVCNLWRKKLIVETVIVQCSFPDVLRLAGVIQRLIANKACGSVYDIAINKRCSQV